MNSPIDLSVSQNGVWCNGEGSKYLKKWEGAGVGEVLGGGQKTPTHIRQEHKKRS